MGAMRRIAILGALAAAALGEGELREGDLSRGERDAPAVCVRLRDGGLLQVREGDAWRGVTLEECSEVLSRRRDDYADEMAEAGKPALHELPHGGKVTRLYLAIDACPTAPWQHLQWLMTIAAEQKYCKLELSDGIRTFVAVLPADSSRCRTTLAPAPEPLDVRAVVHLAARGEEPARWGDIDVKRPAEVRTLCRLLAFHDEVQVAPPVACGELDSPGLAETARYLEQVKEAVRAVEEEEVRFRGEIRASHRVPFANVLEAMEAFVRAGILQVDLFDIRIPDRATRNATRLPYPLRNDG
jgi:hypothetical protein